jgi:hypothetical protein
LQALAYLLNFDKIVKKIEAVAQRVSWGDGRLIQLLAEGFPLLC